MKTKARIIFTLIALAAFVVTTSCREDAKKEASDTETTTVTTPEETKTVTPTSSQPIAKNPAHGQPGHRCDIPVGAPLNSPPANTGTQVNTNTGSPMINPNNSGTATPKINPPHGQPGHRCDVKVGDPL